MNEAEGLGTGSLIADPGDLLTGCRDGEALAQRLSELALGEAGASIAAVFLRRELRGKDRYVPVGIAGAAFADFPRLESIAPERLDGANPFFSVFVTERPSAVPDIEQHPAFRGLPDPHPPARSFLAVPLPDAAGRSLGVLELGHPDPHRFEPAAVERILDLARRAGQRLAQIAGEAEAI